LESPYERFLEDSWLGFSKLVFSKGLFKVGDGKTIRFWEDTWLGFSPLAQQYPTLFNIVQHKHVTVASVLSSILVNMRFTSNNR
jgi:hypothetical protein